MKSVRVYNIHCGPKSYKLKLFRKLVVQHRSFAYDKDQLNFGYASSTWNHTILSPAHILVTANAWVRILSVNTCWLIPNQKNCSRS